MIGKNQAPLHLIHVFNSFQVPIDISSNNNLTNDRNQQQPIKISSRMLSDADSEVTYDDNGNFRRPLIAQGRS